jgi:hypothetical protein
MRTAAFAALAAALAVAGCGDGDQSQSPVRPIKVTGNEQQELHQASDLNRAIALKRAIYDSGYKCQRVVRSGYVGDYKNLEMWMASCADGRDWAVFIGPDGSAQVRDCRDVAGIGLPQCKGIKEEGGAGKPAAG